MPSVDSVVKEQCMRYNYFKKIYVDESLNNFYKSKPNWEPTKVYNDKDLRYVYYDKNKSCYYYKDEPTIEELSLLLVTKKVRLLRDLRIILSIIAILLLIICL